MMLTQTDRVLRILLWIACLSFIPALFIGYIGEEGLYTVSSYEMAYHHSYLMPIFLGQTYWRPPLFNWLIIPVAEWLGWPHMLIASRLITALATIGTGLCLMYLSQSLFKNKSLSMLIGLIYLTSDAGLYHGWIAYADPLYTFFAFSAITLLWLSGLKNSLGLFLGSLLLLSAAYLTKALTVYYFYLEAWIGLAWYYKDQRSIFYQWQRLCLLAIALCVPLLWQNITHGHNGPGMVHDILAKFSLSNPSSFSWLAYFGNMAAFLFACIWKLFPISLLFFYSLLRKRFQQCKLFIGIGEAWLALSLAAINILPYLLSTATDEPRYIMMSYPLIALFLGVFLWNLPSLKPVMLWLILLLTIKLVMVCIVLPLYEQDYRGDYAHTAAMILHDTHGQPLYSSDYSAVGESVLAFLDIQQIPLPPITINTPQIGPYFLLQPGSTSPLNPHQHFVQIYPSPLSHSPVYLFTVS
jgi:hypothetical protein